MLCREFILPHPARLDRLGWTICPTLRRELYLGMIENWHGGAKVTSAWR